MRRKKICSLRCAAGAAVLSLLLVATGTRGDAAEETTSLRSIADLSGQIGEWLAKSALHSLDMLGISSLSCNCTFTADTTEQIWLFHAEPKIRGVDRDGPSHGKLKKGDVIVAIDDMLITTRKAGVRFANLVAGEPVELTVRRGFGTRSVTIVPRAMPEPEERVAFTLQRSGNEDTYTFTPHLKTLSELARSIENLSELAADIAIIDSLGVGPEPGDSSLSGLNINFGEMMPRGWIGVGLLFKGSIRHKEADEPAEWRFNTKPSIRSVQPGSPADRAGLQVNDVLLEIDGLKIDSKRGGARFSRMEPGQTVEWKVLRGGKTFTVTTVAGQRP